MSKTYVLDTNVILKYPNILTQLKNCNIVIPSIVLEEVDKFKSDNELGKNAREFSRIMDNLHQDNYYLKENDVYIEVLYSTNRETEERYNENTNDNKIIQVAVDLLKENYDVELLSNDINVRIKARGMGLIASDYDGETKIDFDSIYKGWIEYYTDGFLIDKFYKDKFLSIEFIKEIEIHPHMFIILRDGGSKSAIGKVNSDKNYIELINSSIEIFGLKPKNSEQRMLLNLLLDDEIPLVTVTGSAGTGKTLLSIASALSLVKDYQVYEKIILTKPTVASGEELGFLPGNIEEKLAPWLQSYKDNLDFLLGENNSEDYELLNIKIEALTYMRGRSLPNQFIIVDEVQNLSKKDVKTILTRIGEGSKIILLGDLKQIDNKKLDEVNNGLAYIIKKFIGQKEFGYVHLDKGVRSKLATLAAKLL